jgi:hypothetical protein
MFLKIYYKIWTDLIKKIQSIPANKNSWKILSLIFMTMAMAINLVAIMTILQLKVLKFNFYDFKPNILPGSKLDSLISFFVLFFLPNLLLNYFLIFRNNRYETLLTQYKSYDGKLFFSYFAMSLLLPLLFVILWKLFF